MRIAGFLKPEGPSFGLVTGDGVIDPCRRLGGRYDSLRAVLAAGDLAELAAHAGVAPDRALSGLQWLPAVPEPGKILCVGLNHRLHVGEAANRVVPEFPRLFSRFTDTLMAQDQAMLATTMRDGGIKPEIEVFDLAMLYNTADLVAEGLIEPPPHVQFVFGVKHALPARRDILEFEAAKLRELLSGATWTAAGVGRHQFEVASWAREMGGHCRTGLEDNTRMGRDALAPSNAALVEHVAGMAAEHGRPVATAKQAREMPGLRMPA